MKPIKKVILLHDLCGVGKAALTNMLPILGVMGVEACPVPTVLLSTHTGGYGKPAVLHISPEYIRSCADHYKAESITFDAIFIGYIGDISIMESIAYFLEQFPDVPVIFDPIMGDHGRYYSNFDHTYLEALKELISYADILMPNFTEFCFMAGLQYKDTYSEAELFNAAASLDLKTSAGLVITSAPDGITNKNILTCQNGKLTAHKLTALPHEFHGSGDAFDGVFLGSLLKNMNIDEAVRNAHDFVCRCIQTSAANNYPEREGLMIETSLSLLV